MVSDVPAIGQCVNFLIQLKSTKQVHEWRIGDDKVKSKIEIDPATQMDAGLYECTADNMYAIDRRSFKTDFSIVFD